VVEWEVLQRPTIFAKKKAVIILAALLVMCIAIGFEYLA
jgi:hypothetical protein